MIKGEIPMRDLVYRVLDLPSSMKALVYDFGRLSAATEREYINQIVTNRVCFYAKGHTCKASISLFIMNRFVRSLKTLKSSRIFQVF